MNLSKHIWIFSLLLAFLIACAAYLLQGNVRVEREIRYYDAYANSIAIEIHRLTWSTNQERSICTTAQEQIQPPYSHNALPLLSGMHINACIFRNGTLYIDFDNLPHMFIHEDTTISPSALLDQFTESLYTNHRIIRNIAVSIQNLPY